MNFVDKDGTTKVYIPVHPWLEHETKISIIVKFGFDMTSCEIDPVSMPICLAVKENSFIHSCF